MHKGELAFYKSTENYPTNICDVHSTGHSDDVSEPELDITFPSSCTVSYDVQKFYLKFDESTALIFRIRVVPIPRITSLMECTQKAVHHVTSSTTASETRPYYKNIYDIYDKSNCAEPFPLRTNFHNSVAFIRYCDNRQHAMVCDDGRVGAVVNQTGSTRTSPAIYVVPLHFFDHVSPKRMSIDPSSSSFPSTMQTARCCVALRGEALCMNIMSHTFLTAPS